MAWQAPLSQTTTVKSLTPGSGVFIGPDVQISAPDIGIHGLTSGHKAIIYGTVAGGTHAARFGDDPGLMGHDIEVKAGGILQGLSEDGHYALLTLGRENNIDNAGVISALGGAVGVVAPISSTSTVVNSGVIEGGSTAIANLGLSEMTVTNTGLITGGSWSFYGSSNSDMIFNNGRMIGDVELGQGDDAYGGGNGHITGTVYGGFGFDTIVGGTDSDLFYGGDDNDLLSGNAGNDALYGDAGDDVLEGGLGADALFGGLGNDTYVLADGQDTVNDAGGTADVATTTISRSFQTGGLTAIENIILLAGNIDAIGNSLANVITGSAGNNVLDGAGGLDTLRGGLGNDTYVLANGNDIVEDSGGAADLVTTTISRSLLAGGLTTIENLTLLSGNIAGTGNNLNNVITGSAGNNVLDGGAGLDRLRGGLGNDTYVLANSNDVVEDSGGAADLVTTTISRSLLAGGLTTIENLTLLSGNIAGTGNNLNNVIMGSAGNNTIAGGGGADTLRGLAGNDTLGGGVGNDTLAGGLGVDRLTGGAGNDAFVFDAPLNASNRDVVTDFYALQDTFRLDDAVMTKLGGPGALKANFFHAGVAAHDADDHIIYNRATGVLSYDSDGNGALPAVQFGLLENKPADITASDFIVM